MTLGTLHSLCRVFESPFDFSSLQYQTADTRGHQVASAMASTTPGRIGLFDLPPELRNEIYAYALAEDKSIVVDRSKPPREPPALLRVCRQVYHEAWPMFYSVNIFQADCCSSAKAFLGGLSDKALSSLQCLRATTAEQSSSAKFMPGWWCSFVVSSLKKLYKRSGRRKVSADALFMPLPIGSTWEVIWITSAQVSDFAVTSDGVIIRVEDAEEPFDSDPPDTGDGEAEDSLSDSGDSSESEDGSDAGGGSDSDDDDAV